MFGHSHAEGIDGLKSHTSPGRAPALTDAQMAALKTLVIAGPNPAEHKVLTLAMLRFAGRSRATVCR